MSNLEIEEIESNCEGPKRLRVPYKTRSTCPKCGKVAELDHSSDHYFSYVHFNKPKTLNFFIEDCYQGEDWCEWSVNVIPRFTLEKVEDDKI